MRLSIIFVVILVSITPSWLKAQEVSSGQQYLTIIMEENKEAHYFFTPGSSGVTLINNTSKSVWLQVGDDVSHLIPRGQTLAKEAVKNTGSGKWEARISSTSGLNARIIDASYWKKERVIINGIQLYPELSSSDGYVIRHNKANAKTEYFENGQEISKRKFRPRAGSQLRVEISGDNPFVDSFGLKKNEFDLFLDDKDKFLSIAPSTASNEIEETQQTDAGPQSAMETVVESASLKDKLVAFNKTTGATYDRLSKSRSITAQIIAQELVWFESNMRDKFQGLASAQPSSFETFIKSEIKKEPEDERNELTGLLETGMKTFRKLNNYQSNNHYLVEVGDKDVMELTLEWYRKGTKVADPLTLRFYNKGEFVFNFSTGLLFHGLIDDSFTTRIESVYDSSHMEVNGMNTLQIDTTKKARILQEQGKSIDWSIPVLGHFYWRNGRSINVGLTLGALIDKTGDDAIIRPLAGGSVILGRRQRLVLSGGAVFGNVKRLATGLEAGENGTLLDLINGETLTVNTEEVTKTSLFFAVTYNIGK